MMRIAVPRESKHTAAEPLFDVLVLGFDSHHEAPIAGLRRVFGLDEPSARSLVAALPAVVCRRVNQVRAEYFTRALRSIGARIEVQDEQGRVALESAHAAAGVSVPANDVERGQNNASPSTHTARAATLLQGGDAFAPTLTAVPAPQLPHASELSSTLMHVDLSMLEAEPDLTPVASHARHATRSTEPAPRVDASEGGAWGDLMRDAPKPRPVSTPLGEPGSAAPSEHATQAAPTARAARTVNEDTSDPAQQFGALSLPPDDNPLPMLSIAPPVEPKSGPLHDAVSDDGMTRRDAQPRHPALTDAAAHAQPAAPARREPALAAARPAQARVARVVPSEPPEPSYWDDLGEALLFPWRDRGVWWVISIVLWALVANVFGALAQAVPFMGTTFVLLFNSALLALTADFHRRCMWGVANADSSLDEGPDFDPARILHHYMRAGVHVTGFLLVSQLPVVIWLVMSLVDKGLDQWLPLVSSWKLWLIAALPAVYWPMAIATASLYSRYQAVWYLPLGLRALARAPLEYASIVMVGAVAFLIPWTCATAIARAVGLPSMFFLALAGLPLAVSHALMGALTGHLMRARPALFE
ncbi:MAG: hypothetical protein ABW321_04600 [Polyangiales bacterium]